MPDYGSAITDKAIDATARKITRIYKQAAKDLKAKLKDFNQHKKEKQKEMLAMVKNGEITKASYESWLRGQVFIGTQWQDKIYQTVKIIQNANAEAALVVNNDRLNVFAENYNFAAYQLEKKTKGIVSFNIYDDRTVARLIKEKPKMLPSYKVNEPKDYKWNRQKVENAVTQGIIQGEGIDKITDRMVDALCSTNENRMRTFSRTAMTGAQNAGRQAQMEDAEDQGIKVKKRWIATLDDRTRDTHAELDGQEVPINQPFEVDGMEIMFPGDPNADPSLVYNCRCTMIEVYEGIDRKSIRRDGDGDLVTDMSYKEWKNAKEAGKKKELSDAKETVHDLKSKADKQDANKVFSGIWKNDVTYADYKDKLDSGSIDAKEQYFHDAIQKAKDSGQIDKADQLQKHLDDLNEFKAHGAENSKILSDLNDAEKHLKELQGEVTPKPEIKTAFGADAYTQDRKDNAVWAKSPKQADDTLRDRTGEVWRNATKEEREGIYEYTQSYHKFNEPLRGEQYGSNKYLGVGNTDLNAGSARNGNRLNAMTSIIDKCSYDQDIWLQRGCSYSGMDKFFGIDSNLFYGSQADLENALLGKTVTEYGFMSCGSAKGKGFSNNIIMNIYAPSGTKMMYAEPFSAFGSGSGKSWDGIKKQSGFGHELETIIQQGTQFVITKVEKVGSHIYVDMDVINQLPPQLYKP